MKTTNCIFGNADGVEIFNNSIGKVIVALALGEDNALHFTFDDGSKLKLYDDGQECCESRYMRTDDNLHDYIGAKFLDADVKETSSIEENCDMHEIQFLEVKTSKGCFMIVNHNKHNGNYSGFSIFATKE